MKPGTIARSVAMSLGNQGAQRSILASSTSLLEDLVMKIFLRPFFLFRYFKKSICQLMAKGWALSTGNLPWGGLPRNSVDGITDRPDMTTAVDRGCKALTEQQVNKPCHEKTCFLPMRKQRSRSAAWLPISAFVFATPLVPKSEISSL